VGRCTSEEYCDNAATSDASFPATRIQVVSRVSVMRAHLRIFELDLGDWSILLGGLFLAGFVAFLL
jgi:hypothetical protein